MQLLLWPVLFAVFNACTIYFDFRQRRVPNDLLVIALVTHSVWLVGAHFLLLPYPFIYASFSNLTISFALALLIFFPLWKVRVMGGGDVKYIATSSYLVGFPYALYIVLAGGVLIGFHALFISLLGRFPPFFSFYTKQKQRRVPYAGYMGLASLIWLIDAIIKM